MKTFALVFSVLSLSLAACATDEDDREIEPIDRGTVSRPTVRDDVRAWAEKVISTRPVDSLDDKIGGRYGTELAGPRPVSELDDKLAERTKGPRPVSDLGDRLNERLPRPRGVDGIDQRLDGARIFRAPRSFDSDGNLGEWAEELVIGGRMYTLIHSPHGHDQLLDALGDVIAVRGRLGADLPAR